MRLYLATSVATVALLFGFPGEGYADIIPGLFNTGVGTPGSPDPNYILISGTAFITAPPHSAWLPAPAGSQWIAPDADGFANHPVGTSVYRLTFDLTGLDPDTAVITGDFAADNFAEIFLNGVDTGIDTIAPDTPNGRLGFTQLTPFSIADGFVPGINILEFVVVNDPLGPNDPTPNPTGLLVTNLQGTASGLVVIPEPSSIILFGLGTIALFGFGWRRRKQLA